MAVSAMTPIFIKKLRSHDYVFIYCFLGWKIVGNDKILDNISKLFLSELLISGWGKISPFIRSFNFEECFLQDVFHPMLHISFMLTNTAISIGDSQSGVRTSIVTTIHLPDSSTFPNYLQSCISLWHFKFFINGSDITAIITGDTICTSVNEFNCNPVAVTAIGITNHSNTVLLPLRLRPEANLPRSKDYIVSFVKRIERRKFCDLTKPFLP